MDMELFILLHTADDFSVAPPGRSSFLGALRVAAFVLVGCCAVGHVADSAAAATMVKL